MWAVGLLCVIKLSQVMLLPIAPFVTMHHCCSLPSCAERRSLCREDDELVGMKCEYALSQGLKVRGNA